MNAFLARLLKDRRGNALLMIGLMLPLLVGVAGLATDTIEGALWKRQLQRAADSAAFAGVYAKSMSNDASAAVSTDLSNDNQVQNQSGIGLLSGYPAVSYPTSALWGYGVKVDLAIQQRLSFSSLFMATPPRILASATAALVDQGDYCVIALENTSSTGI